MEESDCSRIWKNGVTLKKPRETLMCILLPSSPIFTSRYNTAWLPACTLHLYDSSVHPSRLTAILMLVEIQRELENGPFLLMAFWMTYCQKKYTIQWSWPLFKHPLRVCAKCFCAHWEKIQGYEEMVCPVWPWNLERSYIKHISISRTSLA